MYTKHKVGQLIETVIDTIPIVFMLFVLPLTLSTPAHAQVCTGVGYLPAQFAGKPDPWPNNFPLPNDQLKAAYTARYGQGPGNPSPEGKWIPGYADELSFVTYGTLGNAGNAGAIGPDGERLHPGCPTTTEQSDFMFSVPKGSSYVFQWYVSRLDGSSPASAITQHDASKPCGLSSVSRALFGYWTIYYTNPTPCGGSIIPPQPICGDGHLDLGETCQTCPQDQPEGSCTPICPPPTICPTCPAPPKLAAIPSTVIADCTNLHKVLAGSAIGVKAALNEVCRIVTGAQAYQPK